MKLLLIFFIFTHCPLLSQNYVMNIRLKNGTTTSIPIQEIQKLTFSNPTAVQGEHISTVIKTFTLLQNYPNPFNPSTTIEYVLPKTGEVEIRIYNVTGQLVKTYEQSLQSGGKHVITWDSKNDIGYPVASGLYFYQVAYDNTILTKKMLLIK